MIVREVRSPCGTPPLEVPLAVQLIGKHRRDHEDAIRRNNDCPARLDLGARRRIGLHDDRRVIQ